MPIKFEVINDEELRYLESDIPEVFSEIGLSKEYGVLYLSEPHLSISINAKSFSNLSRIDWSTAVHRFFILNQQERAVASLTIHRTDRGLQPIVSAGPSIQESFVILSTAEQDPRFANGYHQAVYFDFAMVGLSGIFFKADSIVVAVKLIGKPDHSDYLSSEEFRSLVSKMSKEPLSTVERTNIASSTFPKVNQVRATLGLEKLTNPAILPENLDKARSPEDFTYSTYGALLLESLWKKRSLVFEPIRPAVAYSPLESLDANRVALVQTILVEGHRLPPIFLNLQTLKEKRGKQYLQCFIDYVRNLPELSGLKLTYRLVLEHDANQNCAIYSFDGSVHGCERWLAGVLPGVIPRTP